MPGLHFHSRPVPDLVRDASLPLRGAADLQPILDSIDGERIVMLGEASHGTHEYYTWRTELTKRLITEKGFTMIAVEGDWPDCFEINRFVKNESETGAIRLVLQNFRRWPTWMWANWEVAALAEWLREHNSSPAVKTKTGFFGLDVYSLWQSLDAIFSYLSETDPSALEKARKAIRCFDPYREDEGHSYAMASRIVPELCEQQVVDLLIEIQAKLPSYPSGSDHAFSAEQNALVAVNAEKYYREMVRGGAGSWNIRDSHMQQTLERLLSFYGEDSKVIVWAHNTHVGDASATDMADAGMYNIGELSRTSPLYGTFLVGFGSYSGTVMAGRSWGAPMEVMELPAAREKSWESMLHENGKGDQLILMNQLKGTSVEEKFIDHRAVGVVYRPEREKYGNYVPSKMAQRYDAFIFIDETRAVHPAPANADRSETPETYPFGV